jgi:hypothetical protein
MWDCRLYADECLGAEIRGPGYEARRFCLIEAGAERAETGSAEFGYWRLCSERC